MPRIDPLSLLKCLSVLLGPTGGIKSKEEVHRLANLMTKFSKKLVSKCIYIQILKTTNTDLLSQFMSAGGWNLIHTWLTDGILAKNWALIQELLELLLLCPVDIERLKSNNCPKLIKGLSKEGSHQGVRILASRLVEQWLKIVKGEAAPNSVPAQIMTVPVQSTAGQSAVTPSLQQQQHYSLNSATQQNADVAESAIIHVQDLKLTQQSTANTLLNQTLQEQEKQQQQERLQPQTVQLQVIGKAQQTQVQQQVTQPGKKQSFVVVSTSQPSVPVYKITIRDGNQVLAKVETDPANISCILNPSGTTNVEVNGNVIDTTALPIKQEIKEELEEIEEKAQQSDSAITSGQDAVNVEQSDNSEHVASEVKLTLVGSKDNHDAESVKNNKGSKDIVNSDSGKSSDKENRDFHKKDDKKSSNSSDKKSSSHHHSSSSKSSKHSASSGTHRTSSTSHKPNSHRSSSNSSSSSSSKNSSSKDRSSKDRDKHHSSKHGTGKSKSERDKEREKEKQKKDQAEKDKATLEKVQGQALSSKLGKIPKKRSEDEKSDDTAGRKSSIDSRDSSKENKEKADSKKAVAMPEKKNISISIESRKNSQDSTTRPKTVKTFNSKFRSTGLEEEVKPPPPRSKKPSPVVDKKAISQKLPAMKRPSPLRDVPLVDKRAKLSLDSPTSSADEKKGGIKLIPPKPKPMVLQESDMFMDALTASTKSKEPRKRKRRISITKDGSSEAKKQETTNTENRESTPSPASPTNAEDKSPVALKPNFKFYQDTLEIEEDKNQKEKENSEEDSKRDNDQTPDEDKDNRDDDDTGSNTPTPEEDIEDAKGSPEDTSSIISDSSKKDNISSYPEIRYVDGLRSVLLLQKRKGPKKILKWKTDLESIRYFELDETERVNVTKTFTDMKQMEKQNEREAFQMARKLNNEDLMEERTRWKPLIPIDLPPPLVEPGKDSREKDIQYAREKGILQALYFNRSMIPDSAAEPDEERHHVVTDPKIIPLEDLTGNKESEKDFTSVPWPEPKPQLTPPPPAVTTFHYPTFSHNQQSMMAPMGPQPTMGTMPQMPQQMMGPAHMAPMSQEMAGPMPAGAGGWRTGDGKVVVPDVGMNPMNMPGGFNQGMEGGPMVPPGMMGPPPMYNQQQEGYGMMGPEDMGGFNNMNPNNFQGPPGPMYGPGLNFPGPRGAPMHNRGRGGPGWYRGGGPPGRGGWRGGGGGWRGSGKQPPVCRQFSKNGYCRVGDKCQYLHPGVNCPPF